jgi:hypothetical protein
MMVRAGVHGASAGVCAMQRLRSVSRAEIASAATKIDFRWFSVAAARRSSRTAAC